MKEKLFKKSTCLMLYGYLLHLEHTQIKTTNQEIVNFFML